MASLPQEIRARRELGKEDAALAEAGGGGDADGGGTNRAAEARMVEARFGTGTSGLGEEDDDLGEEEYWEAYGPEADLEDQFAGIQLHGEEEDDLDLSGEVDELIKGVRWLGLFRVHTTKPFSHVALLRQMRNAWASAQGVTFNVKGPNLFLVQCHCLGEWKRIMEGGPWLFRNSAPVIIQEYDGFTDVNEYKLNKIPLWARVKGLPDGLTAKRELAEKVVAKVGEPPFTVIVNEGKINPASTLRIRVYADVNKPLVRFVPITLKERRKYPVFYDKMPVFCYF